MSRFIRSRFLRIGSIALVVLVGLFVGVYNFGLDWQGRPYCHKQIWFAFWRWQDATNSVAGQPNVAFPNVVGRGDDSLSEIHAQMGGVMDWSSDYNYVPGLHSDDPGQLVLMYFNRPTRWTWHGGFPPTRWHQQHWIIVPVDFRQGSRTLAGLGEMSELVTTAQFKSRLQETLEFVRVQRRPHWQTVVDEHTRFLSSLDGESL